MTTELAANARKTQWIAAALGALSILLAVDASHGSQAKWIVGATSVVVVAASVMLGRSIGRRIMAVADFDRVREVKPARRLGSFAGAIGSSVGAIAFFSLTQTSGYYLAVTFLMALLLGLSRVVTQHLDSRGDGAPGR